MKKVLSSFIAVALILQLFAMVVTVLAEENALITVSKYSPPAKISIKRQLYNSIAKVYE